jgi:hypothetical protein
VFPFFGQIFREISQFFFCAKVFEITLEKKNSKISPTSLSKIDETSPGKKEVVGTFSK